MCCEEETAALLRAAGQRLTWQRMQIACALRHAGRHLTAEQIAEMLPANGVAVEMSTIYRTLARLRTLGLVGQADAGTGESLFEWRNGAAHHHLICAACGDITEIDAEPITALAEHLRTQYRFEADVTQLALAGRCGGCADATEIQPQVPVA